MKYLSGDFVAEYNKALGDYRKTQALVDDQWSKVINKIVKLEVARLEQVVPTVFSVGGKVKDTLGYPGVVIACPIVLDVYDQEEYRARFGPDKFHLIRDEADERMITCEGMLRMVEVEVEASELEQDWGHPTKVVRYYADEFTAVID